MTELYVTANNLVTFIVPPDMTQITAFGFLANPLTTVVLPEPLEIPLAETIATLQSEGVVVFTYPLAIEMALPREITDGFNINVSGPPGVYKLQASDDLATWNEIGTATNTIGAARFDDTSPPSTQRFYRALSVH